MEFTALHSAVGAAPGPITDELLDAAVAAGTEEADNLDWKSALPPAKGLPQTDFPKDVAAMANASGGLLVYGVRATEKTARERIDVGEFGETYERSLRSAAITAISPPVLDLKIHRLGPEGRRAIVVEVPASVDRPHLIYRGEYFGAPVRNGADTVWMKERDIEAAYRTRLEERRRAVDAITGLATEAVAGRDTDKRAWLIAVARPRLALARARLSREQARDIFTRARSFAPTFTCRPGVHPLENVEHFNPRPGLRRWVAANTARSERAIWRESWASVHDDGSATLATAIGGHRKSVDGQHEGWEINSAGIECAVADFMALVRAAAAATGSGEYEIQVGIEWTGAKPLVILGTDIDGFSYDSVSTPLGRYTPVQVTANAAASPLDYHASVFELAQDCINQGGISNLQVIIPPDSGSGAED